jgi:hypothetical protein
MVNTTAIGTLLLLGAVFLSLNALAVSARPGDVAPAEQTIAILPVAPSATVTQAGTPVVTPPSLDPTVVGSGGRVPSGAAINPIVEPAVVSVPGLAPVNASADPIQNTSVGVGIHPPVLGSTPPVVPAPGVIGPGLMPVPLLPIAPGPGKIGPVPLPPEGVEPVRNAL